MNKDDPKLIDAVTIAQSIIRTSSKKISKNTIKNLNNFLNRASFAETRKRLSYEDLEKVLSIAKNIK